LYCLFLDFLFIFVLVIILVFFLYDSCLFFFVIFYLREF